MGREEVLPECGLARTDLIKKDPVRVRRIDTNVELPALWLVVQGVDCLLHSLVEEASMMPGFDDESDHD